MTLLFNLSEFRINVAPNCSVTQYEMLEIQAFFRGTTTARSGSIVWGRTSVQ